VVTAGHLSIVAVACGELVCRHVCVWSLHRIRAPVTEASTHLFM